MFCVDKSANNIDVVDDKVLHCTPLRCPTISTMFQLSSCAVLCECFHNRRQNIMILKYRVSAATIDWLSGPDINPCVKKSNDCGKSSMLLKSKIVRPGFPFKSESWSLKTGYSFNPMLWIAQSTPRSNFRTASVLENNISLSRLNTGPKTKAIRPIRSL